MKTRLAMCVVVALFLTGCSGGDAPEPRPASTASITVRSPKSGEVIRGDSVVVRVRITGARVLELAQRAVRPDTGHVHIAVDGRTITQLAGIEYEVTDLAPGLHSLEVEFSAADHNPFNPRVVKTVTFRTVPE